MSVGSCLSSDRLTGFCVGGELPSSDRWHTTGWEGGKSVYVCLYIHRTWGGVWKCTMGVCLVFFTLLVDFSHTHLLLCHRISPTCMCMHKYTLYMVKSNMNYRIFWLRVTQWSLKTNQQTKNWTLFFEKRDVETVVHIRPSFSALTSICSLT